MPGRVLKTWYKAIYLVEKRWNFFTCECECMNWKDGQGNENFESMNEERLISSLKNLDSTNEEY